MGFLDYFRKPISTEKTSIQQLLEKNTIDFIKEARTPAYDTTAGGYGAGTQVVLPPYDQFYLEYLADNYSHLKTVIQRIASQAVAKGWVLEPTKDNPSEDQKNAIEKLLKNPSAHSADIHGQELIKSIIRQLEIYDDAWVSLVFDYVKGESGDIIGKRIKELWVEDTKKMRFNTDRFGRFQEEIKFCPICRSQSTGSHCPSDDCGNAKLVLIAYTFEDEEEDIYFARDEIIHFNKYSSSARLYGQSPIIGLARKIETALLIEIYQNKLYKMERPPKGFLDIPGHNEQALMRLGEYISEQTAKNPNFIPIISSGEGRSNASFIPVMPTTEELGMLPYIEKVNSDVNASYGIMPLVVGDTAGVGGLNAEGEQITIMDRTIVETQQVIESSFFEPLLELMNVKDWRIVFNPIDDRNEQQHLTNLQTKLAIIQGFQELGIVIDMDEEGELILPEDGIGDELREKVEQQGSQAEEAPTKLQDIFEN